MAKDKAAMLATPDMNLALMSSSVMSRTLGLKMAPSSKTCKTIKPYENGEMLSMFNSVASDMPTLSPTAIKGTSLMISMVPLEILVGMDKAWKKEVFSGPKP